jgi:hypothetical protein
MFLARATQLVDSPTQMVASEARLLCADRAVTVDSALPVAAWAATAAVEAADIPVALVASTATELTFALVVVAAVHTLQVH